MKTPLEAKTAAVAAVPANSTLILFAAVVDGTPTAAQIETARHSVAANLENVGAVATSAYLARFEPVSVNVDADEGLLLTVDATLSKVAPDETPTDPAAIDETAAAIENDALVADATDETPTDAAAIDETAADAETPEA